MAAWRHRGSTAAVAVFAAFLAWTPAPLPAGHFVDKPFEWPSSLQYFPLQVADGLIMQCYSSGSRSAANGTVFFAHGFPDTAASWRSYVEHLASVDTTLSRATCAT